LQETIPKKKTAKKATAFRMTIPPRHFIYVSGNGLFYFKVSKKPELNATQVFYVIQLMLSCELIIPQSCNIKANQVLVLSMLLATCISIFFEGIILIVHIVLLWIQLIKVAKEHLERVAAGIHFKTERQNSD
jgi:hypothetical protein